MSIPFFLVTGFLGSGKTTLLKRFLLEHADRRRIAVIQNEFAAASVDGPELRMLGKPFEILEINKGSVFCVCLLSDFVSSLAKLVADVEPEVLILEATGLADPIAVAQLLEAERLRGRVHLAHAFCVVDATTFVKMAAAVSRVPHQVRIADTVLINKADLAPGSVDAVRARVHELNPFAAIHATTHCDVSLASAFEPIGTQAVAVRRAAEHESLESCGRPVVGSAAVRGTKRVSEVAAREFIAAAAPGTYRIKGFVNLTNGTTLAVQSCFGRNEFRLVAGYQGPTELVAMGPGVDAAEFRRAFRRMAA